MATDNTEQGAALQLVKDWAQMPDGTTDTLDLTEDAWSYGAPPPRGLYDLKCLPAKEGNKWGLEDPKDQNSIYYTIGMECKIVSENQDYDGIPVFGGVTTRIYRGKSISTAAGLINKMGFKVPNPVAKKKLAMLVTEALKKERILKAELDWRGAYSYKDPKTGADVWENVYNHYEEFPLDPEKPGSRKHVVTVASKVGGVAEVRAQLRILRFFGKDDKLPTVTTGTVVSMPTMVLVQPPAQQPMPQLVQPLSQPQFVQPVNAAPTPITGSDLELMLTEV